jgi:hypothetical protein
MMMKAPASVLHAKLRGAVKPAVGTVLGVAFALLALTSLARAERLDDSASPRSQVTSPPMVSEQGYPLDQFQPGPQSLVGVVKFGRVDYKLATGKFVGKMARIYYVIPAVISGLRSPAGLQVEWRGNGLFANGTARPGERKLVWTGRVQDAFMSEGLDLTMKIDLRELQTRAGQGLAFESFFDIELLP